MSWTGSEDKVKGLETNGVTHSIRIPFRIEGQIAKADPEDKLGVTVTQRPANADGK